MNVTTHTRTALTLAFGLLLNGCQASPSVQAPGEGDAYTIVGELEGLDSVVIRYDEGLYRGGDITSQQGLNELKKLGVRTVFSVTPTDLERDLVAKNDIRLVEVPFTKEGIPVDKLDSFVDQLRSAEQPIYAHCHSGKNRGGTLLAAYRVHVQGWDFDRAKAEFIALGGRDADFPELMKSIEK